MSLSVHRTSQQIQGIDKTLKKRNKEKEEYNE